MQTFLPYPNLTQSLQCLDYRRLGKQRLEVLQLLRALHGETRGWVNHPATRMWRGHEQALVAYGVIACGLWVARGYKDTCLEKIMVYDKPGVPYTYPKWFGGILHATHRAALLHKMPEHYSQFGWNEQPKLDYYWPV